MDDGEESSKSQKSHLEGLQHTAALFACHRGAGQNGINYVRASRALGQSQKLWSCQGTQTSKYKTRSGEVQQMLKQ